MNRPARESRDGRRDPRRPQRRATGSTQSDRPRKTPRPPGGDAAEEPWLDLPEDPSSAAGHSVRLNKYLAAHGVASRRRCDELITEGKISVDGLPATDLGVKIDPARQRVEVDGVVLKSDDLRHRYYLLNKPAGVVCTNDEREQKPRAIDLITDRKKGRIYTVGRLDEDTVGLVLLTSDGDFANRVMHPRYGVPKTYLVKLLGRIDDEAVQRVRDGVYLSEGRTGGARVLVQQRSLKLSKLLVTLREGKNREVRRVFARLGHKVLDLKRVRIGPLDDRGLRIGQWRPLTRGELQELVDWVDGEAQRGQRTPAKAARPTGKAPSSAGKAAAKTSGPARKAPKPRGRSTAPRPRD
jgi:23S rRNA pseudouridine2605 synthase